VGCYGERDLRTHGWLAGACRYGRGIDYIIPALYEPKVPRSVVGLAWRQGAYGNGPVCAPVLKVHRRLLALGGLVEHYAGEMPLLRAFWDAAIDVAGEPALQGGQHLLPHTAQPGAGHRARRPSGPGRRPGLPDRRLRRRGHPARAQRARPRPGGEEAVLRPLGQAAAHPRGQVVGMAGEQAVPQPLRALTDDPLRADLPDHPGQIPAQGQGGLDPAVRVAEKPHVPHADAFRRGDLLGSVGVIVAAAIMFFTGWYYADPIFSVLIGLFILPRTWKLLMQSVNVLLEGTPAHIDLNAVEQSIREVEGVASVHDLHVWSIGSESCALSAHVLLSDRHISEASSLLERINADMRSEFGVTHVTIQFECETCEPDERIICTQLHAPR